MTRWLTFRHWVAIDIAIAAAAIAALLQIVLVGDHHGGTTMHTRVATALACAAFGSVAARRRWPLCALTLGIGAQLSGMIVASSAAQVVLVAVALVTYTVARVKPARSAQAALAGILCAYLLSVPWQPGPASAALLRAAAEGVLVTAVWAIGRAMRSAAAYNERYAQATVQTERLRIARELHDVMAHSMSVIAVQAGVGHFVSRERPEEAAKALAVIETTSRASLAELRRLLGVLREEPSGDLSPAPGLADLSGLLQQTARAGLAVDLAVAGEPRDLPVGADLTAFRVVQESLTNVLKHAKVDRCRVEISYTDDGVDIAVTDNGVGHHDGPPGHGLAGMRERVTMSGGTLEAGPLPRRGFEVRAWLPL